ncbi:MAG: hypothetical protein KJ578_01110 [Bacteroidetes bacterium]|nr:hypothetical protein [Bacteroidota bacterium]
MTEDSINYRVIVDYNSRLIHYTHWGKATRKSIGEAWKQIIDMPEFADDAYNIFTDYSKCSFDFDWSSQAFIQAFLNEYKTMLQSKKQAIVIEDPKSTAISMLFQEPLKHKFDFQIKLFSTHEAAMHWLLKK